MIRAVQGPPLTDSKDSQTFRTDTETPLNNAAPLVRCHYSTLNPTTGRSAPVLRIGTLALVVSATRTSPFASERQVLTFHTRA